MLRKSIYVIAIFMLVTSLTISKAQAAPGLGFGVHGGVITGYNNETLRESIRQSFSDLSDFNLQKDMTDFGLHLDMNSFHIIAFDVTGDYMWRTQNIAFTSGGNRRSGSFRYGDASITGDVKATLPLAVIMPYVGIGLGVHRAIFSSTIGDVTAILPSDQTLFAWDGLVGFAISAPTLPINPYAEWRYTSVEAPNARVAGVAAARLKYQSFLVGVTFR